MKKFLIPLLLIATPAFAQQAAPNLDSDKANMKIQLGQLLQVNGQYELKIIELQKQIDDAKKPAAPPAPPAPTGAKP